MSMADRTSVGPHWLVAVVNEGLAGNEQDGALNSLQRLSSQADLCLEGSVGFNSLANYFCSYGALPSCAKGQHGPYMVNKTVPVFVAVVEEELSAPIFLPSQTYRPGGSPFLRR